MEGVGLAGPRASHAEVERQRRAEVEELAAATVNTEARPSRWQYSGMARLGPSPSEMDGLDPVKQDRWRREFLHLIYKAGSALKMYVWGACCVRVHAQHMRRLSRACVKLNWLVHPRESTGVLLFRCCTRMRLRHACSMVVASLMHACMQHACSLV